MPSTEALELPYPNSSDDADVPSDMQALAEAVEAELLDIPLGQLADGTAGQLIVVQSTGAAAYKALSGDATISESGALTIGSEKVGTSKLVNKGVTTGKLDDQAVTLAKLATSLGLTEGYLADKAVTSRKLAPTISVVGSSGIGTIGSSYEDASSAIEVTPSVTSKMFLLGLFQGQRSSAAGVLQGTFRVDGSDLGEAPLTYISNNVGAYAHLTHAAVVELAASESHTIRLRAKDAAAGGGISLAASGTRLIGVLFAA